MNDHGSHPGVDDPGFHRWARQDAFAEPRNEWRRLFAEAFGTFLLVLVAAGAPVINASQGGISRAAAVTAPGDFPWRRVPAYLTVQVIGAALACLLLRGLFGPVGRLGATLPGHGITDWQAFGVEAVLTLGLVSTVLGTASGAQNVGALSAVGVGAYIALAGLWSSPATGASMNPARSLGPDVARGAFTHLWPYAIGPLLGAVLAVGVAQILRGPGGGPSGSRAAQGTLDPPHVRHPSPGHDDGS